MMPVLEELFVSDREQRAAKRGEDRQLVVGPLDGREGGPQRLDFLAIVKRAAANQQMPDAAGFQGVQIRAGLISPVVDEAPEEHADLARFNRDGSAAPPLRHLPAALAYQPLDECADRVRER